MTSTQNVLNELRRIQALLRNGESAAVVERCKALLMARPCDTELLRCMSRGLLQQNRLSDAELCISNALKVAPHSADLLSDLALIRLRQAAPLEAVHLLKRALTIDPTHGDALSNLANLLEKEKQPANARPYVDRLLAVRPFSAVEYIRGAENSMKLNDVALAIRRGRKAVYLSKRGVDARLCLAEALEAGGRFKQAKFQYLAALGRKPGHVAALSRLLALRGTDIGNEFETIAQEKLQDVDLQEPYRVELLLGLARYYDKREQYGQAFASLSSANCLRFQNNPFDASAHSHAVDRLIKVFSPEFFRRVPRHDVHSARPVFIVGMPRSGTTLTEQILASHSRIVAGGELSAVISIAMQMRDGSRTYPESVPSFDADALGAFAQQYLGILTSISSDADRVTDKMPFNFMHVGLIATLFPNAKIIHCVRDARDTCLSCFFTTFDQSLQFASNLETLGQYYLDYRRLMAHWRRVLPTQCLAFRYEELTDRTSEKVRELLQFCGVEWQDSCLRFFETERAVRTPSRWQVRQPIYRSSVGRWKRYEQQLAPLLAVLATTQEERAL